METVLYISPTRLGEYPDGITPGPNGNFYGIAEGGGAPGCPEGCGLIYKLDPAGRETVLYVFSGAVDGAAPFSGVARDRSGDLYGTTLGTASPGTSVAYKLDPTGRKTVLHTFTGETDGSEPNGVMVDSAGNLYGSTFWGGTTSGNSGCGVVYKLDPAGNQTILYSFSNAAEYLGCNPNSGVVRDSAGNLYGTAGGGLPICFLNNEATDCGVVYKVDVAGKFTVLYAFTGSLDGGYPSGLVLDSSGNVYGAASIGGANGLGVVFQIDPAGNETVLSSFTGGAAGSEPRGVRRARFRRQPVWSCGRAGRGGGI